MKNNHKRHLHCHYVTRSTVSAGFRVHAKANVSAKILYEHHELHEPSKTGSTGAQNIFKIFQYGEAARKARVSKI